MCLFGYSYYIYKNRQKMRKDYDFCDWGHTTPRTKQKPILPAEPSRRSTTPNRLQDRVTNSPLKLPLEKAISKATKENREKSIDRGSRCLGRSSRRQDSSITSMAKKIYYDEEPERQQVKAHSETYNFLKKYFSSSTKEIPLELFIKRIMQEYESLWGTQNVDKIFDDFAYKVEDIFGDIVDVRELIRVTREDGMIGLILRVFKEIKSEQNTRNSNFQSFSQNPQVLSLNRSFEDRLNENSNISGIKNVIQQFMQTMYQCMQNEIYNKFNVQMKRMVVKYRESERILKKVNEKLTTYADVFDLQKKMKEKQKNYESVIDELKKSKQKATTELSRQRDICWNQKKEKDRLLEENIKLKENLQKYQNVVLNRALQNINNDQNLSRHLSSRVIDKGLDQMTASQLSQNPTEPFKITIDTHVIHKQNGPPESKTYTTLHNPPTPTRRQSQNNPPSSFYTSGVSSISPLKPYTPYQSRLKQ